MGSETPYSLMETLSLINRSTKRTQRLANHHCFPFKTNGRKCDLECPIHGTINSCEIEGAYLGRVLSIVFYQKNYIMTFSEKNILVKMNNHLFYCRCFQIFYYFMFPEKST